MARFTVSIGGFYDKRLEALANLRGVNKTTLANFLLMQAIQDRWERDSQDIKDAAAQSVVSDSDTKE